MQRNVKISKKAQLNPVFIQDVINVISSQVSYVEGLAALSQTSKQMHQLVAKTPAGIWAKQVKDPDKYAKNYEYAAMGLGYATTAVLSPVAISICLLGAITCLSVAGDPVIHCGIKLFQVHKPIQASLLNMIENKREAIRDKQHESRAQLYSPM